MTSSVPQGAQPPPEITGLLSRLRCCPSEGRAGQSSIATSGWVQNVPLASTSPVSARIGQSCCLGNSRGFPWERTAPGRPAAEGLPLCPQSAARTGVVWGLPGCEALWVVQGTVRWGRGGWPPSIVRRGPLVPPSGQWCYSTRLHCKALHYLGTLVCCSMLPSGYAKARLGHFASEIGGWGSCGLFPPGSAVLPAGHC